MYNQLLQFLRESPTTQSLEVVDLKVYGKNAFRVKVHVALTPPFVLQIWLNHNPRHIRYAYQLLKGNTPLIRWDNAPHHPFVKDNFPHHFHTDKKNVIASLLTGDPLYDLATVLAEIQRHISTLL
jgi:hypothetical protein